MSDVGPNKAIATGLAGAAVIVVTWTLKTFFHIEVPAEVALSLGTLFSIGAVWYVPHGG